METPCTDKEENAQLKQELVRFAKARKFKKNIISVALILAAILVALTASWLNGRKQAERSSESKIAELEAQIQELKESPMVVNPVAPTINLDILHSEIQNLGELATTEYLFTDAAKFSDSKQIKSWNIPFTEKSFILRWSGTIKAGIELNKVSITIDESTKRIIVSVPTAQILSYSIDSDSVEVLNEKDNIFNSISIDDKVRFDAKTEIAMKQRAIENGLLEKAQKNAEDVLTRLIQSDPAARNGYTVEFVINDT